MLAARSVLAFALACLCSVTNASAQSLTLEQALERAREHAPDGLSARQNERAARAEAEGAGRWPRTNPRVLFGGESELASNPSWLAHVGIEQEFDIAGLAGLRGAQARAGIRVATASMQVSTQDLLRGTAAAFIEVDTAQRSLLLWNNLAELFTQIATAAERLETAGLGSHQQTLLAQIERTERLTEREQQRMRLANAQAELAVLVGSQTPSALIAVTSTTLPAPDTVDENTLFTRAVERRPEFATLRAALEEAELRARAATRALIPAPTLGLSLRWDRLVFDPGELHVHDSSSAVADHRSIALAAELSLPLPFFDRNQSERARASADTSTINENQALAERRLRAELHAVTVARSAAWNAYQQWELLARTLDETEELARRGYEAGQVRLPETLLSLERVARGRLAALQARQTYANARINFARAVGDLR